MNIRRSLEQQRSFAALVCLCALAVALASGLLVTNLSRAVPQLETPVTDVPAAFATNLFSIDNYEVTGVSDDGRIIGLTTDANVDFVAMDIDMSMRKTAWIALPVSAQNEPRAYVRDDPLKQVPFEGVAYAMIMIQDQAGKTSVLVQMC